MEYVKLYRELMRHNEWDDVAAFYDSSRRYFMSTFDRFREAVNVSYFSPVSESNIPLGNIHASHKVIFVFAGEKLARNILCLALHFRPSLIYPIYQWIFHDRTEDQLWQNVSFSYAGDTYSCSQQQMMQATEGTILNVYRLKRENSLEETDVGFTLTDFYAPYQQQLSKHLTEIGITRDHYTSEAEDWAPLYYDAVWAMALALDRAEPDLMRLQNVTLSEYKYGAPQATALIRHRLSLLDFEGLSRRIMFRNETHDTTTIIDIYQIAYNSLTHTSNSSLVGSYTPSGLTISPSARFVAGSFEMVQESVHPAATVILVLLVLLCTGCVATLHILFIYHCNSSPIRASSPRLTQLIFSGCYLIMLLAFFLVLITSRWVVSLFEPMSRNHMIVYGMFCCVSAWNISAGYTLILSSLVVQLWRIYNIFNHFNKELRFLSDEFLVCIVTGILALNCSLQVVWISTDPQLPVFEMLEVVETYNGSEQPIIPLRFKCHSESAKIFDSATIALNGVLSISLVVLSILNRHIRRKNFSNYSGVNLFVYVFIVISILGGHLVYSFDENSLLFVVMFWEFCFLSTVFIVSLFLFLPRVKAALAYLDYED
jgi:hypothetical protein